MYGTPFNRAHIPPVAESNADRLPAEAVLCNAHGFNMLRWKQDKRSLTAEQLSTKLSKPRLSSRPAEAGNAQEAVAADVEESLEIFQKSDRTVVHRVYDFSNVIERPHWIL